MTLRLGLGLLAVAGLTYGSAFQALAHPYMENLSVRDRIERYYPFLKPDHFIKEIALSSDLEEVGLAAYVEKCQVECETPIGRTIHWAKRYPHLAKAILYRVALEELQEAFDATNAKPLYRYGPENNRERFMFSSWLQLLAESAALSIERQLDQLGSTVDSDDEEAIVRRTTDGIQNLFSRLHPQHGKLSIKRLANVYENLHAKKDTNSFSQEDWQRYQSLKRLFSQLAELRLILTQYEEWNHVETLLADEDVEVDLRYRDESWGLSLLSALNTLSKKEADRILSILNQGTNFIEGLKVGKIHVNFFDDPRVSQSRLARHIDHHGNRDWQLQEPLSSQENQNIATAVATGILGRAPGTFAFVRLPSTYLPQPGDHATNLDGIIELMAAFYDADERLRAQRHQFAGRAWLPDGYLIRQIYADSQSLAGYWSSHEATKDADLAFIRKPGQHEVGDHFGASPLTSDANFEIYLHFYDAVVEMVNAFVSAPQADAKIFVEAYFAKKDLDPTFQTYIVSRLVPHMQRLHQDMARREIRQFGFASQELAKEIAALEAVDDESQNTVAHQARKRELWDKEDEISEYHAEYSYLEGVADLDEYQRFYDVRGSDHETSLVRSFNQYYQNPAFVKIHDFIVSHPPDADLALAYGSDLDVDGDGQINDFDTLLPWLTLIEFVPPKL